MKKKWKKKYKANVSEQVRLRLNRYKDEKGGACSSCGYNRNYAALNLHHVNGEDKLFTIASMARRRRCWNKIEAELKKCELLCMNCHMETTHPQQARYR